MSETSTTTEVVQNNPKARPVKHNPEKYSVIYSHILRNLGIPKKFVRLDVIPLDSDIPWKDTYRANVWVKKDSGLHISDSFFVHVYGNTIVCSPPITGRYL